MHSTRLCIFARPMSRISDGAMRSALIILVVSGSVLGSACKELDGRNGNRKGNRLFREMQFIDAAAEYEKALKQVDQPIIHYNLGLAYSKMYKPGADTPVIFGEQGDPVCTTIPNTKPVQAQVCIKRAADDDLEGRRRFNECDEKNVCPSSFECKKTTMCAGESPVLADLAAQHFQIWIKSQPSDDELRKSIKAVRDRMRELDKAHEARLEKISDEQGKAAEIQRHKNASDELSKRIEELTLKDDTRKLMTQVWIDTEQFGKAIAYWESELAARPNDPGIMGNLAGINLKSGDWRKSIEWYRKVAEAAPDPESKIAAYQFIGNVAWSKLNSRTLSNTDSVELADLGIGALQKAAEISPKTPKLFGLQASIYNFRSLQHGASWASAIERASAQDLQKVSRVLTEEAKKQQGQATPATPAPASPTSPSMSGGPAEKSGG